MDINELSNSLSAILGQFTPSNLGSRLFMEREEIETPQNFLIWFHERFHYLQVIFTPYGHLKWGAYRTFASDIVECWIGLSKELNLQKKIPINEYWLDDTKDSIKVACNVLIYDLMNDIYKIVEQGSTTHNIFSVFKSFDQSTCCPIINLNGKDYNLRGVDILESFAKFEEAMLGELITNQTIDEIIDPNILTPEYYVALYFFIEKLGPERLVEFPVVCELSLSTPNIPSPSSKENFCKNAPNWRFVKIIETIKNAEDLPIIDFNNDSSFYEYSNAVLRLCGYETFDEVWYGAEKYAKQSDLTMAKEMASAIEYKKKHPWMLSYPMVNQEEFFSYTFNRFVPYFTILDDGVSYNCETIKSEELVFENHLQAFAQQICGYKSKYCQDSFKLMCGYTYMGLKVCPHYISGECDGHIDQHTQLPKLILDSKSNIKKGCTFEIFLKSIGVELKELNIGNMTMVTYEEITNKVKDI